MREVWIIDPRGRSIEVRTKGGDLRVQGEEAATSNLVAGLELVPNVFFGDQ